MTTPIKLQLHLENCDTLEFDWEHVNGLSVKGVTQNINITNKGVKVVNLSCTKFFVDLKKGSKGQYQFDNGGSKWKKRLAYGDVTSLTVLYADGKKDHWVVEWPDDADEYKHPHQGIVKNCFGGWIVYCCKRTKGGYDGN